MAKFEKLDKKWENFVWCHVYLLYKCTSGAAAEIVQAKNYTTFNLMPTTHTTTRLSRYVHIICCVTSQRVVMYVPCHTSLAEKAATVAEHKQKKCATCTYLYTELLHVVIKPS